MPPVVRTSNTSSVGVQVNGDISASSSIALETLSSSDVQNAADPARPL